MAPTLLRNTRARAFRAPEGPTGALAFHRRMPAYEPTPLSQAPGLATMLGVGEVWVKDESSRMGLPSFKLLGASWATYRALVERLGAEPEWSTIEQLSAALDPIRPLSLAAATDGNHGRAVARMGKLLALPVRIFVPAGTVDARIEGIQSEGAEASVVDGDYDDSIRRAADEASDRCLVIADTSWPGYADVPRRITEGYTTIGWEIEERLAALGEPMPDAIAVQIGVGSLGGAMVSHFRRAALDAAPTMIAVEPRDAACLFASVEAGRIVTVPGPHRSIMAGLNCGTVSDIAWPLLRDGFEAYVRIGDDRAREGMRALASVGVVSGESGAAGLGGLLELVGDPELAGLRGELGLGGSSRVLLISTEGATDPDAYLRIVGRPPEEVSASRTAQHRAS